MASWSMISMQDSASPIMEQLIFFHDYSMMILVMITSLVCYLMFNMFTNKFINRNLLHGQLIEIIWTVIPSIILLFMAMPSLRILYMIDEMNNPLITLKTIGHQWYWSYEYSNLLSSEFDSYMIPTNTLNMNDYRLLEVDNRLIIPMHSHVHMLITAADVIHSWTVPSLGIKIDGTPGRLNQTNFSIYRPGLFYGQCSEICGMNHSFMPIVIESIPIANFISWTKNI